MQMTKKHQKHTKIEKANVGYFHSNEFSILGTPCGEIRKLAYAITKECSDKYELSYIDADHKSADDPSNLSGGLAVGMKMEYVDKIDFHRFDELGKKNKFDFKAKFLDQDLVIVNGNHF